MFKFKSFYQLRARLEISRKIYKEQLVIVPKSQK